MTLKAPFPYFGGKSRVADEVWTRFGDVANYVEPFCGSAAVLLSRPSEPRIETVNDANCFISNFWRAVQHDPEAVAHHADWPVNEADLHARHRWLMLSEASAEWRERMKTDPDHYDAKIAGWWVWGASCWIGTGWCDGSRLFSRDGGASNKFPEVVSCRGDTSASSIHRKLPSISTAGTGVHQPSISNQIPHLSGSAGVRRQSLRHQLPDLAGDAGAAGRGIHASALHKKMPNLQAGHGGGSGLHRKMPEVGCSRGDAAAPSRQLPHVAGSGRGDATARAILEWFDELAQRLRRVRVVCGDWSRVVTPAVTVGIGTTAVFLDPPYADTAQRTEAIYSHDDLRIAHDVRDWAIANGGDPSLRIALCGYEGEHVMPDNWSCFAWQAQGGYANQKKSGDGFENRKRERIWFSPHCLTERQQRLIA